MTKAQAEEILGPGIYQSKVKDIVYYKYENGTKQVGYAGAEEKAVSLWTDKHEYEVLKISVRNGESYVLNKLSSPESVQGSGEFYYWTYPSYNLRVHLKKDNKSVAAIEVIDSSYDDGP